ncbi:NADH-quinone oxidoreductase subunit J [Psychrobacter sp. PL15]|uniref:NADH-quinone oxidoreductase subunit J n=1 Tax=Psychrobacter sp. PL15 TaxID=3071719 RepID=UPI002E020BD6|nr:NADH-quinone oxidoreductase subunit J [Psychrobacter sp. PL15]
MMDFFSHPDLVGFYALAAVAIFASLRVIIHPNAVHAILAMIVSLLAVAGILFILGAPFAGALEVVVYAGAILVLFVFVIMMLNLGMANEAREESWLDAKTWAVPTGLTIIIAVVLYAMIGLNPNEAAVIGGISIPAKAVGVALFSKYIVLVEVAALLLLAALVAAYHLGKESITDEILADDSQNIDRRGDDFKDYLTNNNNQDIDTRADAMTETPETYEYKEVDPHDYVGMQVGRQKDTRKESD